ncbi:MAG: hypothetical protein ABS87_08315 [Sphingomonas sp. SCN 67-18]|uniref:DUF1971 domain-containing protein n=1 Tax=uncultured Sphingomonas sp. TaxID=158754 RepID=UPI000868714B|nr:DUF1971 domain-containing protein [Sphingomonas sp. SCN 67-18]ODU20949.1 MAG: hypothetical protein ABS87_08315 [Sphingomonas sp. SCN 67-18]
MDRHDRPQPYASSPVFDQHNLPDALRREHRTKPGVWGVVRALDGHIRLCFSDGSPDQHVAPGAPGLLLPDQPHWVYPSEAFRMQVDFYDIAPDMKTISADIAS